MSAISATRCVLIFWITGNALHDDLDRVYSPELGSLSIICSPYHSSAALNIMVSRS